MTELVEQVNYLQNPMAQNKATPDTLSRQMATAASRHLALRAKKR
jgi:hypothetical protein